MAQRCHECGLVAPDDRLMHKYYPGPRGAPQLYCPACWARREKKTQKLEAITVVAAVGVLAVAAALAPAEHGGALGRLALGIVVIEIAATFLHELGHAAVARLVGMKVFKFSVGLGRTLYTRRVGDTEVEINLLPVCGYVRAGDTTAAFSRSRNLLMIAGGPAVNAAIAALGFVMVGDNWDVGGDAANVTFWHLVAGINAVIVVLNLVPMIVPGSAAGPGAAGTPNDGMLLILTLLARGAVFHHWLAHSIDYQARDLLKRGDAAGAERVVADAAARYPANAPLRIVRARTLARIGRFAEARDQLRQVLALDKLDEASRLMAQVELAEVILDSGSGDAAWIAEADAASDAALQRAGGWPAVRMARGRALVATGWVAKGCAMLHQLLGELSDPSEQAECACHLARAELEQKDAERARHYLALARSLDAECRYLAALEAAARSG